MNKFALAFVLVSAALAAGADTAYPPADWREAPSPWANPAAPKGGRLALDGHSPPKSLNYYLENSSFSAQVFFLLYDTLLSSDPATGEHAPGLVRRWTVSDDGLVFMLELDPAARWSDGEPVTAEDVRWTFEALVAPESRTGPVKVSLAAFGPPEVLAPDRIRFTARENHWRNLGALGGIAPLPSHAFAGRDFNEINFDFPVVSGPYRLGTHRENVSLSLARRPDWWAAARPANAGLYNFDELLFRFSGSQDNAFDAFRKGLLDVYPVYSASIWVKEARGDRFDRNWIVRRAVRNRKPVGFQGFAMNLRRAPYDDPRVRRALAHTLDREGFNRTLMYGQYFLHRSYWEDLYDEAHPCTNELLRFDPPHAAALLAEAGWAKDPATGALAKDGRPFVVLFLSNGPTADRFLARWKRVLADLGIALETERKDWAAWARDMDAYNFDMTWAAWGAGLYKDPESLWSSAEAARPSGNNITGFADPRVDALIDAQRAEFDVAKRHEICRRIGRIFA